MIKKISLAVLSVAILGMFSTANAGRYYRTGEAESNINCDDILDEAPSGYSARMSKNSRCHRWNGRLD
tara:strand:- start:336 stop:539 length:204 start_codon:yes stop_codon:yes gene_type:complete